MRLLIMTEETQEGSAVFYRHLKVVGYYKPCDFHVNGCIWEKRSFCYGIGSVAAKLISENLIRSMICTNSQSTSPQTND